MTAIQSHEELRHRLLPLASAMSDELSGLITKRGVKGRVHPGAYSTERYVIAYVSYLPDNDPTKDTIDAMISVGTKNRDLHVTADVCVSNGRVLFEAADEFVPATDWIEAVQATVNIAERASSKLLEFMAQHLTKAHGNPDGDRETMS